MNIYEKEGDACQAVYNNGQCM